MLTRRTGAETSTVVLKDDEGTELVLEVDSSVGSGTNSPQRLSVEMRSRSEALSLPALRRSRCFTWRLLRCAAFAACIIFFVTSAKRLASSISSSMSILGRLPFLGRPPRFGAATGPTTAVSDTSTGNSVAVDSSAMTE